MKIRSLKLKDVLVGESMEDYMDNCGEYGLMFVDGISEENIEKIDKVIVGENLEDYLDMEIVDIIDIANRNK